MDLVEQFIESAQRTRGQLKDHRFRPDAAREDWSNLRSELAALREDVSRHLIDALPATQALLNEEEAQTIAFVAASITADLGAVYLAAGDRIGGKGLLERAAAMARETSEDSELVAGAKAPEHYLTLAWGRWQMDHDVEAEGRKTLEALKASDAPAALREAAKEALNALQPIASAPTLYTLNGIGTMMYGSRDRWDDGSVVSTLFFVVVFLPFIPIRAYRVHKEGNGYRFYGTVPLSSLAIWYRRAVLASFLIVPLFFGVVGHFTSGEFRAGRAYSAAVSDAADQGPVEAGKTWQGFLDQWYWDAEPEARRVAAEGVAAGLAAELPEAASPEGLDAVVGLMLRAQASNAFQHEPGTLGSFVDGVLDWTGRLAAGDPAALRTRSQLLDRLAGLPVGPRLEEVRAARDQATMAMGEQLAEDWPTEALELFVTGSGEAVLDKAGAILESRLAIPGVGEELEHLALQWLTAARRVPGLSARVEAVEAVLAGVKARQDDAERLALLISGDLKAIQRARKKAPKDDALAVAYARLAEPEEGRAALEALGSEGHLSLEGRRVLADVHAATGDLEGAEAILDRYLEHRLAKFQTAAKAFDRAYQDAENRLVDLLNSPRIPSDIRTVLDATPQDQLQEVAFQWIAKELEKDPALARLESTYQHYTDVVPVCLRAGTYKLQVANGLVGKARDEKLADAERVLLAIRQEAQGLPTYHIDLGTVYYRLGKNAEGEAEFQGVLALNNPSLDHQLVHAYRSLGNDGRAVELAEDLWARATSPMIKEQVAFTRAILAWELDDKRVWLERANGKDPSVKSLLFETRGLEEMRAGNEAAADGFFAKSAELHRKTGKKSTAGVNNLAIALTYRYEATGNPAFIESAVKGFEDALRLAPADATITTNFAGALEHLGTLQVLDGFLKTKILRPDARDAKTLAAALAHGEERDAFLEAWRANPLIRRAADVSQQEQVLSPQSTVPLERRLFWAEMNDDEAGLTAIAQELESASAFDTRRRTEWREAFIRGEKDTIVKEQLDGLIATYERAVDRADATGHAPTRAAARVILADSLARLAELRLEAAPVTRARALLEEASGLWAPVVRASALGRVLVTQAILSVVDASHPAIDQWREGLRKFRPETALFLAMRDGWGGDAVSRIRGSEQLDAWAQARKARDASRPTLIDLFCGELSGDAELKQRGAKALQRKLVTLPCRIDAALDPTSYESRERLKLVSR